LEVLPIAIKNKTKYALLGVLSLKPGSGYDIKKFCDKSISYFWNENFGHIYPVLAQLEKEELIVLQESDTDDRKKVYNISDKGLKEFTDWLLLPAEYQPPRSELLLKMSFSNNIPSEKTIEMLQEVKERKKRELKEYLTIEASYQNTDNIIENDYYPYWLAPLRFGILSTKSTIKWCDETIVNIEKSTKIQKSIVQKANIK
jgi:PadR family transcriptional regulator, regulatory protein AphA